eukprot:CFRG6638T1
MAPWDDPFATVSSFGEIFYLVWFWMLLSNAVVYIIASLVAVASFRRVPHRWLIIFGFILWSLVVSVFVGGTIGILTAGFFTSGDYSLQRVLGMSIGVALTFCHALISVFRWLATMP